MPQRNRDKIMQQSFCDLPCKINGNLYDGIQCVIEAVDGKKPEKCRAQTCDECIQKWLTNFSSERR